MRSPAPAALGAILVLAACVPEEPNLAVPAEDACGAAALQHHRGVRVGVNETWQDDVVRPLDRFVRVEPQARLRGGHHRDDAPGPHRHGVVVENAAVRFDRKHPAGTDERVDGLHADRVERRGAYGIIPRLWAGPVLPAAAHR